MIVSCVRLDAAARGVDVSTPERMAEFADAEIVKLRGWWNRDVFKRDRLIRKLEQEIHELRQKA